MKLLVPFALALAPLAGLAQTLTNDGATITVGAGATLYVAGSVDNKAAGTLVNNGTVQLTGDLTNAGTLTSPGTLLFAGSTNQTFSPGPATVAALTLNNSGVAGANTLRVAADLSISGALTLLNGLVRTAPVGASTPLATLTLPDGATLTGEAAGRYVQGNLRAVRNAVNSTAAAFPNSAALDPKGQNLGTVTVTRTAGLLAPGLSYGQNTGATTKGIDRVWSVVATLPPAALVNLALSWVADDDNGFVLSNPAQLFRAASAAGPWGRQGAAGSAATRSFAADATTLGTFTLSNANAPLPVELTRFTAEPTGDDALLRWATASEKNNDRFEVEASADGQAFRRIGTVAGHGNSTQPREYQFVDKSIARYAADPVYYRLRQVDQDGSESFSPVRTVRVAAPAGLTAAAWPNPFATAGPALTLRTALAGPATLLVHDALGRRVLSRPLALPAGTTTLPLAELGPLATGVYVLTLTQGAAHVRLKLVRE